MNFTPKVRTGAPSGPVVETGRSGFLQRACSCSQHACSGGECEACKRSRFGFKRHFLLPNEHLNLGNERPSANVVRVDREHQWDFSHIPTFRHAHSTGSSAIRISHPNDLYEKEADRVADQVIGTTPHSQASSSNGERNLIGNSTAQISGFRIQRQVDDRLEEEDEIDPLEGMPEGLDYEIMRKASGGFSSVDPGDGIPSTNKLQNALTGGEPLPETARRFMEPRFNRDFSAVRIHNRQPADQLSRDLNAVAFTYRNHIYFRSGQFNPHNISGRRLLAHELTHVVQQTGPNRINRERARIGNQPVPNINTGVSSRAIQRKVEMHVNLAPRQHVRMYEEGVTSPQDFLTSAGPATESLISCNSHSIIEKVGPPPAMTKRWGLQYFSQITSGGIGFHSNIAFPLRRTLCADGVRSFCTPRSELNRRVRRELIVDGTARSHGCMRLAHNDARLVFNKVQKGENATHVFVYRRRSWRPPSWDPSPERAGGPACRGETESSVRQSAQTYTVRSGDTLSEIADQHNVSLDALRAANGDVIREGDEIRPGDVLTIP